MTQNLTHLFAKNARKDDLLARMTRLPDGYTHVGVVNVRPTEGQERNAQVTLFCAAPALIPLVYDAIDKEWKELVW